MLLFLRRRSLQPHQHGFGFLSLLVFIGERGLGNLVIELTQALLRTGFGMMGKRDIGQHLRVAIADGDPVAGGHRRRRIFSGLRLGRCHHAQEYVCDKQIHAADQ